MRTRSGGPQRRDQQFLILRDGVRTIEASKFDELVTRLRELYPDGLYERYLHQERDVAAEHSRSAALEKLGEIFVTAAAQECLTNQVSRAP